eukprot:10893819-Ditylum_brightwellii.AAC.1
MGIGGEEMKQMLLLLDLPHSRTFEKNATYKVEVEVGKVLRAVAEQSIKDAMLEEIEMTLNERHEVWKKYTTLIQTEPVLNH